VPEMTLRVRWPDGRTQDCYSPSLVLDDHLDVGARYTVADFADRSVRGLEEASDRVAAAYGFACTSAAATIDEVRASAASYAGDAEVTVLAMWPPLPEESS